MDAQARKMVDIIANGGKNVTASDDHRSTAWVKRRRGRNRTIGDEKSASKRRG